MIAWEQVVAFIGVFGGAATILWVSMDRAEQDSYLRWIGVRK